MQFIVVGASSSGSFGKARLVFGPPSAGFWIRFWAGLQVKCRKLDLLRVFRGRTRWRPSDGELGPTFFWTHTRSRPQAVRFHYGPKRRRGPSRAPRPRRNTRGVSPPEGLPVRTHRIAGPVEGRLEVLSREFQAAFSLFRVRVSMLSSSSGNPLLRNASESEVCPSKGLSCATVGSGYVTRYYGGCY